MKTEAAVIEQALNKLRHFCSYQERCHQDVIKKLFDLRISSHYHPHIIAQLIETNYLNEERFAIAYARGKMRMNCWGRVKIAFHLKTKNISPYCIKKAIDHIDKSEYENILTKEFEKKWQATKGISDQQRFYKTRQHLISKGFEPFLIEKCKSF